LVLLGFHGSRRGRLRDACSYVSGACLSFRASSHRSNSSTIQVFASRSDLKPFMSSVRPSGHFAATHHRSIRIVPYLHGRHGHRRDFFLGDCVLLARPGPARACRFGPPDFFSPSLNFSALRVPTGGFVGMGSILCWLDLVLRPTGMHSSGSANYSTWEPSHLRAGGKLMSRAPTEPGYCIAPGG
jgi:hypothetical protein